MCGGNEKYGNKQEKHFNTNKTIYKSIDSYDNFKYIIDGLHSTYDEIKK